jgi:hypothetical protein
MTNRQLLAIGALVAGLTVERAARRAKVSKRTVLRWTADPSFSSALKDAREAAFSQTLAHLEASGSEAVEELRNFIRISKKRADSLGDAAQLRLAAAKHLLATMLRAHDAITVEARLAAIEERIAKAGRE